MNTRWQLWILFFLVAVLPARAAERVALVIGCGAYQNPAFPRLETPARDADDLARLLATPALGFDTVVAKTDVKIEEFYAKLREFKAKAAGARVTLVYFSGHGLEVDGRNFLIPVDATLDSENQLETQTMELRRILDEVKGAGAAVNLVILDCCRDSPPARTKSWLRTKSVSASDQVLKELGEAEIPRSTLVCFAASAGRKAAAVLTDGSSNSPFTQFLLEELPRPGLSVRDVFERVHDRLFEATLGRQAPAIRTDNALSPLFRTTVLVRGSTRDTPLPPIRPTPTPAPPNAEQTVAPRPTKRPAPTSTPSPLPTRRPTVSLPPTPSPLPSVPEVIPYGRRDSRVSGGIISPYDSNVIVDGSFFKSGDIMKCPTTGKPFRKP